MRACVPDLPCCSHFEPTSCQIVYQLLMIFILSDRPSLVCNYKSAGANWIKLQSRCLLKPRRLRRRDEVIQVLLVFAAELRKHVPRSVRVCSVWRLGSYPHSCVYSLRISDSQLVSPQWHSGGDRGGALTWSRDTRGRKKLCFSLC